MRDWESGDRAGTTVEVDADALGHDLSWGTSVFTRSVAAAVASDAAAEQAAGESGAPSDRAAVLESDEDAEVDPQPIDGREPVALALPF